MNHGKKMFLISPEAVQRLQAHPSALPQAGSVNTMDLDMTNIMKQKNLSDFEKWSKYSQILQRYLKKMQDTREPIKIPLVENTAEEMPLPMTSPEPELPPLHPELSIVDKVVNSFNAQGPLRKRAVTLIGILLSSPDISWDAAGRVTIKNISIPGANIVNLLNDVIRSKRGSAPQGWEQFATLLYALDIPRDIIGNKNRWDYILRLQREVPNTLGSDYRLQRKRRIKLRSDATVKHMKTGWEEFRF